MSLAYKMKSFSEVFKSIKEMIMDNTVFTNFNESAGIRHITEIFSKVIADLYLFVNAVTKQTFISTAEGKWLDLICEQVGVTRLQGCKARHYVIITRTATSSWLIPAGTVFESEEDLMGVKHKFLTLIDNTFEDGDTSITIKVEAEDVGADFNVAANTITSIDSTIPGVNNQGTLTITNPESFTDPSDSSKQIRYLIREGSSVETDDRLRERTRLIWQTLGLGGTREAYRQWAMNIPGVRAVSVPEDFPEGVGTVKVIIVGEEGGASEQLLSEVRDYINYRKPLTAHVIVEAPQPHKFTLTLNAILDHSGIDEVVVEKTITAIIEDYMRNLSLGEGLVFSRLISKLLAISGVYDVEIMPPEKNIEIGQHEILELTELTVSSSVKGRKLPETITFSGNESFSQPYDPGRIPKVSPENTNVLDIFAEESSQD